MSGISATGSSAKVRCLYEDFYDQHHHHIALILSLLLLQPKGKKKSNEDKDLVVSCFAFSAYNSILNV